MFNCTISSRHRIVSAAALLALTFGPAHAQQDQQQDQQTQQQAQQQDEGQQAGEGTGTQSATGTEAGGAADALIATVGEEEVRASDVMAVIEMMPPRVRQQPQEMLVPMAIEQVVLQQLILQQALAENLREDAEVVALVEETARATEEDAMVSVWLRREMEERVTDARVQEVYDRLQSESEQELPPLEEVRPQIEQQLGRDAIEGIRSELGDNISVVYYGPDGQPLETTVEAEPGAAAADQEDTSGTAGTDNGAASGGASTGGNDTGGSAGTTTGTGDAGTESDGDDTGSGDGQGGSDEETSD